MPRVSQLVETQAEQEKPVELTAEERAEPTPDVHAEVVQGKAETYEVKIKKMAVRKAPNMSSDVLLVLHQGERVCGVPQKVDGLPWLRLSRETMKSHPLFSVLEQEFAWALVDATDTDLGLGRLLERAAMELGWCAAEGKRSDVWEVVGKGDVTVTTEKDLSSDLESSSLEPGSLIKALEHDADEGRLHYQLLAGHGPEQGWVTVDRLVRISHRRAAPAAGQQHPTVELDEEKVEKALKWYGEAFCRKSEANGSCSLKKTSLPWRAGSTKAAPAPAAPAAELRLELEAALEPDAAAAVTKEPKQQEDAKDEKKGDEICGTCRLPLGDLWYMHKKCSVHAECMAQILLQEMKEEEDERQRNFQLREKMRHEEFGIGWSAAKIPLNSAPLKKLSGEEVRHGLLALALTPEGGVTLVPTACPGAAVNLEYLSTALKIRLEEGTEPTFSLDPVDPTLTNTMQIKRFEPAWLKGTAAGDVLFESDYHLKELSMGEFEQPVVGMKSCFDHSDEESYDKEWNAREWYVVRKAEVQMSEDGVLVPWCKMGVEAREQIINDKGELEDQRVTRPDHPLVTFAEEFTKNFDLIAERKSVVYHLRELAKASVLAKYLEQSDVELEGLWCDLYGEQEDNNCILEVPQVWNERLIAQIQVSDGKIVDGSDRSRAVYGGARFGLNRLRMSPMAAGSMAAGAIQARRGFIPPRMGFQARRGFVPPRGFVAPSSALTARRGFVAPTAAARGFVAPSAAISARPGFFVSPSRLSMPTMSATMPLRGVDLNLDSFNLTETLVSAREGPLALSEDLADCTPLGSAFWPHLDKAEGSILGEEERSFLKELFHPCLSDRRMEGELFVPPDTSAAYGDALKGLLRKEREVRQKRKDHFFSTSFVPGEAGPLFPFSWTTRVEIARGRAPPKQTPPAQANLKPLADFKAEVPHIKTTLESSTPVFEQNTEDGLCFRTYRLGSLEVRTTQEHGGEEAIGAVFTARVAKEGEEESRPAVEADEKVEKATLFVEGSAKECIYYVVLETITGSVIVTEKLRDGTATWEENPRGLAERNSLAKVIRAADGLAAEKDSATVHTLKIYQGSRTRSDVSLDARQRYAEGAFSRVARRSHCQQLTEPFETYAARNYPRLHAFLGLAEKKAEVA